MNDEVKNEKCISPDIKKKILELLNKRFYLEKNGMILCRECRNESLACVCMDDNKEHEDVG